MRRGALLPNWRPTRAAVPATRTARVSRTQLSPILKQTHIDLDFKLDALLNGTDEHILERAPRLRHGR